MGTTTRNRTKAPARKPTAKQSTGRKTIAKNVVATEEAIRQRAFDIYMARGGQPGRDLDDWLQAERELRRPRARA